MTAATGDNVTALVNGWSPGPVPRLSVQGTLALDVERQPGPPEAPEVRTLPGADVVPVADSVRAGLHRWALQFSQACVEVIGGNRPAAQLVRWTTPQIHQEIAYRAGVVARAGLHAPGPRRRSRLRPQVQNVRTCFVADHVVEMCVRVRYGERNRFIAGRLEVVSGRWQCTALEFG